MSHFRQGNMEAAQANFEAMVGRDPGCGPARFRLSMVHSRRGRHLAAIESARLALLDDPQRIELITHLARCHLMAGQPELARVLATRALALPRDNPVVLDSLAVLMTRLDEPSLAMELFDQAIALDSRQASMYFNRALAQRQFGMIEGAESDLEACIARNPGHAKAHSALAHLRTQDLIGNHVSRLRQAVESAPSATPESELLTLALFKELDDLGDIDGARLALTQAIASRRQRNGAGGSAREGLVEAVAEQCDESFCRPRTASSIGPTPLFVFGMRRSGVALLGKLLSRHSRVRHLGQQQPFSRLLSQQLGRDSVQPFTAQDISACSGIDFEELGRRYLSEVSAAGDRPLLICESQPMNFQLAGLIARALPRARMLHVVRDPLDNCLSLLAHADGDAGLPVHDPGALAASYLDYHRLMQHWQQVLPGRMIDVSYESLVEKPEMVLRVVCSFLGIRYGSALRMGLQLHQHSVGRGRRYAPVLPALESGLAPLHRQSRRA